jgi:hypothetical protein
MSSADAAAPAAGGAQATAHAMDWDALWRAGVGVGERFDIAGPHACLTAAIRAGAVPAGRALVPGCGRGYDVVALAAPDRFVVGLDLSTKCVEEARAHVSAALPAGSPAAAAWDVRVGDFFASPAEQYTFIYDYTFLCALLPARRAEWAAQMAALLSPGGTLMTLQFPLGPYGETHPLDAPLDFTKGPPFLLTTAMYADLLLPAGFELVSANDVPPAMSFPKRAGVEAVAVWRRK